MAQTASNNQTTTTQSAQSQASVSSTSKVSAVATKATRQLDTVKVTASEPALGGGLMTVQDAPKAVSTVSRQAIQQAAPGANFTQAIESIPGVITSTDDFTGLNDGNYSIRGFTSDEIGTTVNGAPINDSGSYQVYASEYGDTENMGDITVQQGWPDVDQPIPGAAGGTIGWATIDPSHTGGVDFSQTLGDHSYHRTFVRLNTGDMGPVRSWISFSNNEANIWDGPGKQKITKVDGKLLWTIDDRNSVSFSMQYNREVKNSYMHLTRLQAAEQYDQNYVGYWGFPPNTKQTAAAYCGPNVPYNACYYGLHVNPFKSALFSADGEFTLTDNLHLSVVPYFQYGSGGGSGASLFTESTANHNQFGYVDADLNGDGIVKNGTKGLVYGINQSYTYRPGVIAKLSQDFGNNDTLVYGVWWERPREQQDEVYSLVDPANGAVADIWGNNDVIRYPNGQPMRAYAEYTATTTEKAFATNTWTPTEQLSVSTGIAYIWAKREGYDFEDVGANYGPTYDQQYGGPLSATYHKWSPTVGVKYQINDANQVFLGAGRSFRTPVNGAVMENGAAADLAVTDPYPGHEFNATNKPETSTTVDLGYRFYTDRLSASVDAYAANFRNKQVSGYDENSGLTVYTELPNVHMRGLNGEASVKLNDMFSWYTSYTYTVSRQQANLNAGNDGTYFTAGKTLTNTPLNAAYSSLNFHEGPIWASLNAKFRGAVWGDWSNTQKVGGYTTFNLNAGYDFSDFSSWLHKPYVKVNVYNLTDHHAFTWAYSSPFLASTSDASGNNKLGQYYSPATYSILQERTWMVTIGASFD